MKKKLWFSLFIVLSLIVTSPLWTQETDSEEEANQILGEEPPKANDKIQMDFRGASLDTVLDYLSEAAGFIIIKQAEIDGPIDAWSHQSLTSQEAVELLNTVLHEKGYAAIRRDRTLTIVPREEAKIKDIPVKIGNNPEEIPRTDETVTQIIPVRHADATQLLDNLSPLLPEYASMTANQSSNAVIITDTQSNIYRMVKIIRSLDTSISSIATIRVFPLDFSDATELANIVNELFEVDQDDDDRRPRFGPPGRGGRGDDDDQGSSEARKAASRVVAVADENTNSLVVSAAEEYMPMIEQLVNQIDTVQKDLTEVQVFKLEHADAFEVAEQITELFPDESQQQQNQFMPRFGRGPFGRDQGNQGNDTSERKLRENTVRATADQRTNSVIVLASEETMTQIEQMIERLDQDDARTQKVYVYNLEFADVENVAEILRNIFETQNMNINRNTATTNQNTLSNRNVNVDTQQFQTNRQQ